MGTESKTKRCWSAKDQRLRQLRESRTMMSQEQFAAAIGEKGRTYGTWERGESPVPLTKACRIADFYGCTVDEICGREVQAISLGDDRLAGMIEDYLALGDIERVAAAAAVRGIASETARSKAPTGAGETFAERSGAYLQDRVAFRTAG